MPPDFDLNFTPETKYSKDLIPRNMPPEPENPGVISVINELCDTLEKLPLNGDQSQATIVNETGKNVANPSSLSSVASSLSNLDELPEQNELNEHNGNKWSDICLAEEKALLQQNDDGPTNTVGNGAKEVSPRRRVFRTMYVYNQMYRHWYVSPNRHRHRQHHPSGDYYMKKHCIHANEPGNEKRFTGRTFGRIRMDTNNNGPEAGAAKAIDQHEKENEGIKGKETKPKGAGRRRANKRSRKRGLSRRNSA